jgi:hypothetical protein
LAPALVNARLMQKLDAHPIRSFGCFISCEV